MKKLSIFKHIAIAITLLLQPAISLGVPLSTPAPILLSQQYPVTGRVKMINRSHISVADFRFKLSPTVKITLKDNKKGSLRDLKAGDLIGLTLLKLGKKNLVDTIHKLPEAKSGIR